MSFEDYFSHFKATNISADSNPKKFEHVFSNYNFYHEPNPKPEADEIFNKELAFFNIELSETVDCSET